MRQPLFKAVGMNYLIFRNVVLILFLIGFLKNVTSGQRCIFQDTILIHNFIQPTDDIVSDRSPVNIFIMFNVLYEEEEENISDNQILSQIEVLNEDFNALNIEAHLIQEPWKSILGNARIHFCLYQGIDAPFGIRRRKIVDEDYSVFHSDQGGIDAFKPDQILNIWVTKLRNNPVAYTLPIHESPITETGIVADYRYVGRLGAALSNTSFNLGRTLTHEIGHFLGLLHVWGNNTGECEEGDLVEDTPDQSDAIFGCPNRVEGCGTYANFNNFMNLVDDPCMIMFTQGQVQRMHWYIETYLPNFINPLDFNCSLLEYSYTYLPNMSVFPNPSNGAFVLQNPDEKSITIFLRDINGRLIYETTTKESFHLINVSAQISTGIYYLSISSDIFSKSLRVMIHSNE